MRPSGRLTGPPTDWNTYSSSSVSSPMTRSGVAERVQPRPSSQAGRVLVTTSTPLSSVRWTARPESAGAHAIPATAIKAPTIPARAVPARAIPVAAAAVTAVVAAERLDAMSRTAALMLLGRARGARG